VQLPEVERDVRWGEYVSLARTAEAVGFDSIRLGDHLLYRAEGRRPERGPWDSWSLLAALAGLTERVTLGPLVACTAFHPPGILARMAAAIDEISNGRFVLGLGAGWNEDEFRAFGIPFDHRASRFEEAFEIVRRLLSGERVTFTGRYVRVDDAVLLPRPKRRPAMMVGSNGERILSAALPHVDVWNTWYVDYGNTPAGFERLNAMVDEVARRCGRGPEEIARSACVLVVLDRTIEERSLETPFPPLEGSHERIASGLRQMAEAGADEVILVLNPITDASMRRLGAVIDLLEA
jgi:probable F420-dependent oxidoreductase